MASRASQPRLKWTYFGKVKKGFWMRGRMRDDCVEDGPEGDDGDKGMVCTPSIVGE
jgi:hypothetical protein